MRYDVLYLDPPWQYRNVKTGGSHTSGAAQQYPTLSFAELSQLPLADIAARNSVMFLWATVPLGGDPYDLMSGWGWGFKTEWFWHKTGRKGTGYWTRGEVEKLLIGVRGDVKAWRSSYSNWLDVYESTPEGHSRKPAAVRQRIEELTPDFEVCLGCHRPTAARDCGCPAGTGMRSTRRVELFATERPADWDAYGLALDPSHDFRMPEFWEGLRGHGSELPEKVRRRRSAAASRRPAEGGLVPAGE